MKKYCNDCEMIVILTEDGYCTRCGKHADNMPDEYPNDTYIHPDDVYPENHLSWDD